MKSNISFSQFIRVKRNCTKTSDFHTHASALSEKFTARGYPDILIKQSFRRALNIPRSELLKNKPKTSESNICFSLLFSPLSNQIKNIVSQHWHILGKMPGCSQKPHIAMSKSKSIRDILVHLDIDRYGRIPEVTSGHHKCLNCVACKYVIEGKELVNPQNNRRYALRQLTSWSSKFCIYAIFCQYQLIYVGSTSRSIKVRILEHVARIKNKVLEAPLISHFENPGHDSNSLRYTVIEQVKGSPGMDKVRLLHQREIFWTFQLNSSHPNGLNEKN